MLRDFPPFKLSALEEVKIYPRLRLHFIPRSPTTRKLNQVEIPSPRKSVRMFNITWFCHSSYYVVLSVGGGVKTTCDGLTGGLVLYTSTPPRAAILFTV